MKHLIEKNKIISILILGLINGFMSFLFLAFINYMISLILEKEESFDFNNLILFGLLLVGFIWSRRALSHVTIKFSQKVFWRLRTEVLKVILKANYSQMNKRKDQVHSTLTHDIEVLTSVSLDIIQFLSSAVVVLGCLAYMWFQSIPLCLITIGTAIAGALVYQLGAKSNHKRLEESRDLENDFMHNFLAILSGFREIHMNPKKGKDIYSRKIKGIAKGSIKNNIKAYTSFLNNQITGQVFFYALIAFILLFHSLFTVDVATDSSTDTSTNIINFVFILLYLLGSIESIMILLPGILQAKVSSGRLKKLLIDLDYEHFETEEIINNVSNEEFRAIEVTDLSFQYDVKKLDESFGIGPVNFSIEKGSLIFIYGGNGSGKTTFVNALLGLLKHSKGEIKFNGVALVEKNYKEYKTLFSVVYSDFYLFDEFYGIDDVNMNKLNKYVRLFELNDKVVVTKKGFESVDVSTGQRKRIALITALLEDRPVLVLDEWAADQDPYFRKIFYTKILPELKEDGFTIIAITHDDNYYHCADKLYKMEYGKLIDESSMRVKKTST